MESITYTIRRIGNGFKAVYVVKYDGEHGKRTLYTKTSAIVHISKKDAQDHAEEEIKYFNEIGCIPLDAA
ncbi:MAG: hypothetical protein ACKO37_03290 [Vampirovibrionales bacterium]